MWGYIIHIGLHTSMFTFYPLNESPTLLNVLNLHAEKNIFIRFHSLPINLSEGSLDARLVSSG